MITYYMMRNSDYNINRLSHGEHRAIKRMRGMLLIVIAVQYVMTGKTDISPPDRGGYEWETGILHQLVWY